MEKMNVDIEEIKQMQQKGYIGWSKYLLLTVVNILMQAILSLLFKVNLLSFMS
jgi:hypothetical protein